MDEQHPNQAPKTSYLLTIAFALPLVFIVTAFVVSYLPSANLSPQYNFIYATCSKGGQPYRLYCGGYLQNRYEVVDSILLEQEISETLDSNNDDVPDIEQNFETRFFLHDVTRNLSNELSLSEVTDLRLDAKITSPDGIAMEWEYRRGGGFFPFFDGRSRYGYYLTRGKARSKLNLVGDGERIYYRDDLEFIGWVIDGD